MKNTKTRVGKDMDRLVELLGRIDKKEKKARLIAEMEQLPEKQKLIVSLYFYESLSLVEIGKILEWPKNHISRLHAKGVNRICNGLEHYLKIA